MCDESTNSGADQPAADAICRAKAELEKARDCYDRLCRETADRVKAVRETSVGDVLDSTLATVKRHPGASLTVAALVGFLLGRLFRR